MKTYWLCGHFFSSEDKHDFSYWYYETEKDAKQQCNENPKQVSETELLLCIAIGYPIIPWKGEELT